jgi:hypothetical protein
LSDDLSARRSRWIASWAFVPSQPGDYGRSQFICHVAAKGSINWKMVRPVLCADAHNRPPCASAIEHA